MFNHPGIIESVGEIFSSCGISIYAILQNPIMNRNDAQARAA